MFIGYPKSGHSMIGSMIDAHKNAIISHEFNTLNKIKKSPLHNKQKLFNSIYQHSKKISSKNKGGNSYLLPTQWNGKIQGDIQIIGDKKGGDTSANLHLGINTPSFKKLIKIVSKPVKIIHITRNPYDIISSIYRDIKNIPNPVNYFFNNCNNNKKIIEDIKNDDFIDILEFKNEEFIDDPSKYLSLICNFLELPIYEGYIEDCCSIVYKTPNKSRLNHKWVEKDINHIQKQIKLYPFLEGYNFNN